MHSALGRRRDFVAGSEQRRVSDPAIRNGRVLIVEDTVSNLELTVFVLEEAGYEVHGARTADEALAVLRKTTPDLVLMDIQLPGTDGLALTRRLKSDPATAAVPIIAHTAYATMEDELNAREAGCDDYLTKPVSIRVLLAAIEDHMPGRGPAPER